MNNLAVYYERKEYLPKLFMQKYLVGAQIGQGESFCEFFLKD